ncbi:DUF3501 family protein [Aestuariispira insulae]|uniref:Uncharacterized protein DUF3501 n=1 Tax=Aestuariispira insulae TaxID=1461337 RepID=A0A3D9HEP2_9PROT|nr:DUF3501 family protein [Aestuariispira insulae]RED47711.1 uncharacterized protein DUF3501 [Aestuariispira insulae]
MSAARKISADDILSNEEYMKIRAERRKALVAVKKNRRVEIGPVATAYFESFDTMLHQIQEMLYIEKGGEEQLADELAAYNPLIPNGRELVATVMFEIDDPVRRGTFLSKLGGVEETMFIKFGDEEIIGTPEEDVDRTNAAGKASAVQFVHFTFNDSQAEKFRSADQQVIIGFKHPQYAHMVVLQDATRNALAGDFSD